MPRIPITKQTMFLMQWAHRRSLRAFNAALGPFEIEARHLGILMLLTETSEPLNQKQLALKLELDKSSVVLIMDDLERLQMAKRSRDPRDRRAHAVEITDKGRKCLARAEIIAAQLSRQILAHISQDRRKQLDATLRQIIRNCEALKMKDGD
jgi:MarR family transcriptional regulator, lower aerobic nicotinate degradation pathway regulator